MQRLLPILFENVVEILPHIGTSPETAKTTSQITRTIIFDERVVSGSMQILKKFNLQSTTPKHNPYYFPNASNIPLTELFAVPEITKKLQKIDIKRDEEVKDAQEFILLLAETINQKIWEKLQRMEITHNPEEPIIISSHQQETPMPEDKLLLPLEIFRKLAISILSSNFEKKYTTGQLERILSCKITPIPNLEINTKRDSLGDMIRKIIEGEEISPVSNLILNALGDVFLSQQEEKIIPVPEHPDDKMLFSDTKIAISRYRKENENKRNLCHKPDNERLCPLQVTFPNVINISLPGFLKDKPAFMEQGLPTTEVEKALAACEAQCPTPCEKPATTDPAKNLFSPMSTENPF